MPGSFTNPGVLRRADLHRIASPFSRVPTNMHVVIEPEAGDCGHSGQLRAGAGARRQWRLREDLPLRAAAGRAHQRPPQGARHEGGRGRARPRARAEPVRAAHGRSRLRADAVDGRRAHGRTHRLRSEACRCPALSVRGRHLHRPRAGRRPIRRDAAGRVREREGRCRLDARARHRRPALSPQPLTHGRRPTTRACARWALRSPTS